MSLPNEGNGMYCAAGMPESTETCDECYELLDDCDCEDRCDECGDLEEDCACAE